MGACVCVHVCFVMTWGSSIFFLIILVLGTLRWGIFDKEWQGRKLCVYSRLVLQN